MGKTGNASPWCTLSLIETPPLVDQLITLHVMCAILAVSAREVSDAVEH